MRNISISKWDIFQRLMSPVCDKNQHFDSWFLFLLFTSPLGGAYMLLISRSQGQSQGHEGHFRFLLRQVVVSAIA